MLSPIARVAGIVAVLVLASTPFALAETSATPTAKPATIAQTMPAASPTPNPLAISGFLRAYWFTRQNASNNPGTQFDFSTNKCPSGGTCVNQASFEAGADIHADYTFPNSPWTIGGSYFYGQPFSGPCSVAPAHRKGEPCVSQIPPNTNPDDTLPAFMLSTFPEAYLAYNQSGLRAKLGDQLLNTPWAGSYDATRLKPAAYTGADFGYGLKGGWTFELADMWQFQNRTSNTFNSETLLTSYPAGGGGLASNIYAPVQGGNGITTSGFFYGKVGYAPPTANYSVNGYLYQVYNIVNMYWGDGRYNFAPQSKLQPYLALQGGWESNAGSSVIGKIQSSDIGFQLGANIIPTVLLTVGFDDVPWRYDEVYLPGAVTCSSSTYQISAGTKVVPATNFAYFLPLNTAQCLTNKATGLTQIAYGGWASPYSDNYATDPFFTTQISQGMADRRAPGSSWKAAATYNSPNKKWTFIASDAWYNYGNAIAPQTTNEWNLDGIYHFSTPPAKGHYKGLLLRYRYAQRTLSNTFFCSTGTPCPAGLTGASQAVYLGGLPLFKYNRAQVEYDF